MSSTKCPRCGFVSWAAASACKRCGSPLGPDALQAGSLDALLCDDEPDAGDVRRQGMKKIKAGAAFTALYVCVLVAVAAGVLRIRNPVAFCAGLLPVAWLLAGVLQVSTGVPFEEYSRRWDGLAGWQRGLIGVSVFAGGLLVVLAVGFAVVFAL